MSARIAGDVDQARHQLRRKKVSDSLVRVINRQRDFPPACNGCGYQRCSCPPEPVEEAKPVGEWRRSGNYQNFYIRGVRKGGAFPSSDTEKGFRAHLRDDRYVYRPTLDEAKAWVEGRCK